MNAPMTASVGTPLQTMRSHNAGRLRALCSAAWNNQAAAARAGNTNDALMYQDDAEALAEGAAALEAGQRPVRKQPTEAEEDVIQAAHNYERICEAAMHGPLSPAIREFAWKELTDALAQLTAERDGEPGQRADREVR